MSDLTVERIDDSTFEVTVSDGNSSTTHEVSTDSTDVERLARGDGPGLVEASFRFLLDREPKESIMNRFDLAVISRFFPEYESRIGDYLPRS